MAYRLFKSEPGAWSWDEQVRETEPVGWEGVRNHQAANNMKAMKIGDLGLFYRSVTEKQVVEVVGEYHPDPTDASAKFGRVDLAAARPLVKPVTLAEIKADPRLQDLALIRRSRLSVTPIGDREWRNICAKGETEP